MTHRFVGQNTEVPDILKRIQLQNINVIVLHRLMHELSTFSFFVWVSDPACLAEIILCAQMCSLYLNYDSSNVPSIIVMKTNNI